MPLEFERDDANRRVVVTYAGTFSGADVFAFLERLRQEKIGDYGVLCDLTGLAGRATIAELRGFASERAALPSEGSSGPVAFVASDPAIYGMACTYAALGRPRLTIEVFRERSEAVTWLAAQARR